MIIFDTPVKELVSVKDKEEIYFLLGIAFKKIPKERIPYPYKLYQEKRKTEKRRNHYLTLITKGEDFVPFLTSEKGLPEEGEMVTLGRDEPLYVSYRPPQREKPMSIYNSVPGTKIIFLVDEKTFKNIKENHGK